MKVLSLFFITVMSVSTLGQTPARFETELLGYLADVSKYGNYGGQRDDDKLTAANKALKDSLMNNGTKSAILAYAFPKLREEMYVATSKDGKFRIYSWDMQTGGTMRDFAAIYQFRGTGGKTIMWAENDEDESAGSFYPEIFQVASRNGPIYLATSTFIGSTSTHGQSIKTIKINGDDLDLTAKLIRTSSGPANSVGFGYDFFSVVDRKERPIKLFEFNESRKEFKFPIVVEDDETPLGRVTNKFIIYRFNGTHFVKLK
jgi:hypothetical protein